jgi:hypothetical protein
VVQTGQQFSSFIPYQEPSRYKQSNEHHSAQNHDQQKVGILAVLKSVDDFLSLSHASLDASHKQGSVAGGRFHPATAMDSMHRIGQTSRLSGCEDPVRWVSDGQELASSVACTAAKEGGARCSNNAS